MSLDPKKVKFGLARDIHSQLSFPALPPQINHGAESTQEKGLHLFASSKICKPPNFNSDDPLFTSSISALHAIFNEIFPTICVMDW